MKETDEVFLCFRGTDVNVVTLSWIDQVVANLDTWQITSPGFLFCFVCYITTTVREDE